MTEAYINKHIILLKVSVLPPPRVKTQKTQHGGNTTLRAQTKQIDVILLKSSWTAEWASSGNLRSGRTLHYLHVGNAKPVLDEHFKLNEDKVNLEKKGRNLWLRLLFQLMIQKTVTWFHLQNFWLVTSIHLILLGLPKCLAFRPWWG